MVKTFNYKKNEKESATLREVFVTSENENYVRGLDLSKMRKDGVYTKDNDVLADLNKVFGEKYTPKTEVHFMTKADKDAKKALKESGKPLPESKVKAEWQKYFRTFDVKKIVKDKQQIVKDKQQIVKDKQ